MYACKLDSKSVTGSNQKYILGHPKLYKAFKHHCSFSNEYFIILDYHSICTVYKKTKTIKNATFLPHQTNNLPQDNKQQD